MALLRRLPRAVLVFAGAAVGTAGRVAVAVVVSHPAVGTLLVNLAGSVGLGVLVGLRRRRRGREAVVVSFAAIGLLGAFTTFGGFVRDLAALAAEGSPWGVGYLGASLVGGLVGAAVGRRLGAVT